MMRGLLVLGTAGLICAAGLAQAVDAPIDPTLDWATWGRDSRRSHFQPNIGGLTNPRVRWVALDGAIDEPIFLGDLVVPQMPSFGAPRHVRYGFYDPIVGELLGILGPYWGQAVTPIVFNAAVYVIGSDNSFIGVFPNWPAYLFAGGQYDSFLIAPNPGPAIDALDNLPQFQAGSQSREIRGRPAYRAGLAAYTDGAIGYAIFADNFRQISAYGVVWIVTLDANALAQNVYLVTSSEFFLVEDTSQFVGIAGAAYGIGATPTEGFSTRVLMSDHSGRLVAFDPTQPPPPVPQFNQPFFPPVWRRTVQQLSEDDLLDPNDPSSPPDPIPSDTFDRPLALSADGSTVIVCATNYGRVYAVNTADGTKLWGRKLNNQRRIPIMAGPAIGPDGNGNETVYVVGRFSPSQSVLYALDRATGNIKWSFNLGGVSRCTPTIDSLGNLYIGNERGILMCIDPNGNLVWSLSLGGPIRVAPVLIPLDVNNDFIPEPILFVAASNRFLYAIEPAPQLSGTNPTGGVGVVGGGAGQ